MSEQSEAAYKFEERIRKLLRNLGFSAVDGGRKFVVGGEQIDAIGVFEDKVFVIECTTQRKGHKSKTQAIPTKKGRINKALQGTPKYRADKYYYLYVVGNNSIKETKQQYEDNYGIKILSLDDVNYFDTLSHNIPSRAPYDFLSQLDVATNSNAVVKVPALMHRVGNKTMYSFFANPNDLIKISFVARREMMRKGNYQRMIDSSRLDDIYKYLHDGKKFIPTNVVLAINKPSKFKAVKNDVFDSKDVSVGTLELPSDYDACLVIDGQHRLFAYRKGLRQNLSFLAFGNISYEEQMRQFVTINEESEPINSNLMWDLQSDLDTNGPRGRISSVAKELNKYEPFKGKIKVSNTSGGKISLSAVCIALEKTKLAMESIRNPSGKSTVRNRYYDSDPVRFTTKLTNALRGYFEAFVNDANDNVRNFGISQGGTTVLLYLIRILEYERADGNLSNEPKDSLRLLAKELNRMSDTQIKDYYRVAATSESNKTMVLNDFLMVLSEFEPSLRQHVSDVSGGILDLQNECEELLVEYLEQNIDKPILNKLKHWFRRDLRNIERKLPKSYSSKDFITKLSIAEKFRTLLTLLKEKPSTLKHFVRLNEDSISDNDHRFKDLQELNMYTQNLVSLRNRNDAIHTQLPYEKITASERTIAETNYRRLIACLNSSLYSD